ncbi:MAG: CvpA family protein [Candidatus Izemoplasmatales bacterium]|nr:CvpA family protein [Candidatus Izemoplasmatales bacterium]
MTIIEFGTFGIGIIDVLLVVAIVIFAVIGWKHGFLVKIVEMASGIFGLLASVLLAQPFAPVVDSWMGDVVNAKIGEYLSQSELFSATLSETNVRAAFGEMSLPQFMIDWIVEGIDFNSLATSIIDAIQPTIKALALLVIAFVILFFGSIIVFFILKLLARAITSIPVIKQIDKVLGVLFGIVKIGAIVYILFFVLALLLTIPAINDAIGPFLAEDMQLGAESFRVSKWIYDNNILKQVMELFG